MRRARPAQKKQAPFFTACPAIASIYAEFAAGELGTEARANLIPVHLAIRRPRRMSPMEWLNGTDEAGLPVGDATRHRQRGFDGIVIAADFEAEDPLFREDTFVVFSNSQVRSALTLRPL